MLAQIRTLPRLVDAVRRDTRVRSSLSRVISGFSSSENEDDYSHKNDRRHHDADDKEDWYGLHLERLYCDTFVTIANVVLKIRFAG